MPDKQPAKQPDKLAYLGGQVNALLAFIAASIASHPEPEKFRAAYLRSAEMQETLSMNAAVPEDYLTGERETKAAIEQVFNAVLQKRAG